MKKNLIIGALAVLSVLQFTITSKASERTHREQVSTERLLESYRKVTAEFAAHDADFYLDCVVETDDWATIAESQEYDKFCKEFYKLINEQGDLAEKSE